MHLLYLTVLVTSNMVVLNQSQNQESRVLMLSENARGDANPILLIDEDDVEGTRSVCRSCRSRTTILLNEPWYF